MESRVQNNKILNVRDTTIENSVRRQSFIRAHYFTSFASWYSQTCDIQNVEIHKCSLWPKPPKRSIHRAWVKVTKLKLDR
jgi:hypothetical protein